MKLKRYLAGVPAAFPWLENLAGLLAAGTLHRWMSTLEYKGAFYDPSVDPAHADHRGQKLYIFWHEYLTFPIYLRGHCNLTMMLSQHRDADVLARAAQHLGFGHFRGSTTRGGAQALRQMMKLTETQNITFGVDGPVGPRRTLGQGPIYLASKINLPLVVMGFGYDRPWRAKSWDRFALPKPFSRARGVFSPAITIPPKLDRDGIEYYRLKIEQLLNRLTLEAEAWAEAGTPKLGELPLVKQTPPLGKFRHDPFHGLRAAAENPDRRLVGRNGAFRRHLSRLASVR